MASCTIRQLYYQFPNHLQLPSLVWEALFLGAVCPVGDDSLSNCRGVFSIFDAQESIRFSIRLGKQGQFRCR